MAGRYRSDDGRFLLEGDGAGRWFLLDEGERDELGLPRTSGPFATLTAARDAAREQRGRDPRPSPLAERLAAAAKHPRTRTRALGTEPGLAAPPRPAPAPRPRPATWLDRLEERDRGAALGARRLIEALERHGVEDAEAVVRRDVEGDVPAVAARLLAMSLRRRLAEAGLLSSEGSGRSSSLEVDPSVRLAVETVLETIAAGHLAGSDKLLPGWRLVEARAHPPSRGLVLDERDLDRALGSEPTPEEVRDRR